MDHSTSIYSKYSSILDPLVRFCTFWRHPLPQAYALLGHYSHLNFLMYCLSHYFQSSQNLVHTVNPRISTRGLICKNEFLDGGLFQGLAFSSKVDIKNDIIFSIN